MFPFDQAHNLGGGFETMMPIECQSQASIMQAAFQNPFEIHHQPHENDLNSFVSSVVSKSNLLSSSQQQHQSSYSHKPSNANGNNMITPSASSSLLPPILFSHQDSTVLKQQQQLKAEEASFTAHLEPVEANTNFMDIIKMQPNLPPYNHHHPHPLFFETECSSPPHGPAHVSVCDTSTSLAFNTPHYHTMLHPHINIVHAPMDNPGL